MGLVCNMNTEKVTGTNVTCNLYDNKQLFVTTTNHNTSALDLPISVTITYAKVNG